MKSNKIFFGAIFSSVALAAIIAIGPGGSLKGLVGKLAKPVLAQEQSTDQSGQENNFPRHRWKFTQGNQDNQGNDNNGQDGNNQGKLWTVSCDNITSRASQLLKGIQGKISNWQDRHTNRVEKWNTHFTEQDQRLADLRTKWDARRQEFYAKIEASATTDAQKQAVADFKSAVESAVATRKAAIDAAIAAYRAGLKALIAGKTDNNDQSLVQFQNAVQAAADKAKSDCEAGVDPKTVRQNFHASLLAARKNLVTDRQATEKIGTQLQALIDARQAAFKKAFDNFKAAMEKARADLKKAFGNDTDNSGT